MNSCSDDEYRLLRQNLFERLAGGSTVPTEAPVVPVAGPPSAFLVSYAFGLLKQHTETPSSVRTRRTSSNFFVQGPRTPSLASKKSFQSAVSGFLKRTTSKKRTSMAPDASGSDVGSIHSVPRSPAMSKQTSDTSLRRPSTVYDVDNSPRRTPVSQIFRSSESRSIKHPPSVPPSSFPGATLSVEARIAQMSIIDTLEDDERLQSSKEIRQELENVEAEGRRLLDAFNGLELSTLVRKQRSPGHTPLFAASAAMLHSPIESNALSTTPSLRAGKDSDGISIVSAASGMSRKRSPSVSSRSRQLNTSSSAPVFQPVSLGRKASISSISSRGRSGTAPSAHPSPGRYKLGSTSSINLTRSSGNLPLATVSEHEVPYASSPLRPPTENGEPGQDDDIAALESEMADIRRRRAEVTARYEARIEYLRARLKGAELREKLMKR
jgi:hypothetical protein